MFCFKCGAQIEDNAAFCDKCGARVDDGAVGGPTPVATATPTVPMQSVPVQPAPMNYGVNPAPAPAPQKDFKFIAIIGGIAVVALVAIVALVIVFMGKPAATTAPSNAVQVQTANPGASTSASTSSSSASTSANTKSNSNTVTLKVTAASGEQLQGQVRRDANGYVLGDSSSRAYSMSELRALGLSDAELCVAWNEPFARGGYHFKNPQLRAYFESCSWYTDRGQSFGLSGAAAQNNQNLQKIAGENAQSAKWMSLATS